jgi:hypothetical protein
MSDQPDPRYCQWCEERAELEPDGTCAGCGKTEDEITRAVAIRQQMYYLGGASEDELISRVDSQQQRIDQLEAVLRELLNPSLMDGTQCLYCGGIGRSVRLHGYAKEDHALDCPVLAAKALLDQNLDNGLNKTDAPA